MRNENSRRLSEALFFPVTLVFFRNLYYNHIGSYNGEVCLTRNKHQQIGGKAVADKKDSILTLPGIGPKKAALFAKLGVETLDDLIRYYPRDYEDRTRLLPISALEVDCPACFIASVVTNPQTHRIPKPGRKNRKTSGKNSL